jgi:hypothetical protein
MRFWDIDGFMKWTDGLILVSQQRSCRFMEPHMVIEESSCEESVSWECRPKTTNLEHGCNEGCC